MTQSPSRPAVQPGPEIEKFRVVVSGHDDEGRSVILSDRTS